MAWQDLAFAIRKTHWYDRLDNLGPVPGARVTNDYGIGTSVCGKELSGFIPMETCEDNRCRVCERIIRARK